MALITTGWTYKFGFKQLFSALNGVYTITKIYSWLEIQNEQLSLYELLYAPLNIPEAQYNEDVKNYRNENILKLVSPLDGTIVFAPESVLDTQPIYPVKEYQQLVLFIPLGIYDNPDGLDYLVDFVQDNIQGGLGISRTPSVTTINKAYMTEKEYNELEHEREQSKNRVLNYFTALNQTQKDNDYLKSRVEALEKIIVANWGEKP